MERHNGRRQGRKRTEKDKRSFEGNRDKQRKMLHNCLHVLEDSAFSSHVSIFFFADVEISSFSIIKMLWFILGTIPLKVSRSYFFTELTLIIGAIPL